MRFLLLVFFVLYSVLPLTAQQRGRPTIGLTLSGGGAKGLAHIGILKAIDSAGLSIDYITGTSMGSVLGSLYAIGYSANEIERIARKIDWRLLLTNHTTLRSLAMEEKEEYAHYAVELPYKRGKFNLPSGALESQELWILLSELYFPVYPLKNFNQFPIPFKCIATDISNADAVVQNSGEITTAVRASMAIPGVFTTVENFGRKLVDGGVVRNFPVSDVREMGARIVIGSNVAHGLLPKEQLNNPAQILMQISMFKNADENGKQIASCDYFINQQFKNYGTASFGEGNEITDSGIIKGREYYPVFKHLADSINAIYGVPAREKKEQTHSVFIVGSTVRGLDQITNASFLESINFQPNLTYTVTELSDMIRKGYGTRNYNFIHYTLDPVSEGKARIIFEVEENVASFTKLGIHYNTFTGISLVANFTTRNYFTNNSRSLITLNLGENFRLRAEHLQYLGKKKNLLLIPALQFETFKVNTYNNYKKDGLYRQRFFKGELKMQSAISRNYHIGSGIRYEWIRYSPLLQSVYEVTGSNKYFNAFGYFNLNTLDRPFYAEKGMRINGEIGLIYDQKQQLTFSSNGSVITSPDSLNISTRNYTQALLNAEFYTPVSKRIILTTHFQSGINFDAKQNIFNSFSIGGLNKMYRNQIVFAGLQDVSLFSNSVAALQLGLRYRLLSSIFLIARSNVLANDFLGSNNQLQQPGWLTGHSLSFAYNSILGPIELSGMYCDQAKSFQAYVTMGFSF